MKTISEEIKEVFLLGSGRVIEIERDGYCFYLSHQHNELFCAIPFDGDIRIYEEFIGFFMEDNYINVSGVPIKGLCLRAKDSIDINKYAQIAADFVDKDNRTAILKDPFSWIDGWKTIFGDSIKDKKVYDVIGELLILKHLYSKDKSFVWEGPKGGTHDIVGRSLIGEVKTTKEKKKEVVEINSAYQLSIDKPTKLFFVRIEKKPYCQTINTLVKEIVGMGYNEDELEECLTKEGYRKGNRKRDDSYDLLMIKSFNITKEEFPVFKLEEINAFAPKKNIISFNLGLDLSANNGQIEYEKK